MAPAGGRETPSLKDQLFEHTERFDFVQAVRVLARLYPERAPVGGDADPGDEVVLSATVHNYLAGEKTARVSLRTEGLEIVPPARRDPDPVVRAIPGRASAGQPPPIAPAHQLDLGRAAPVLSLAHRQPGQDLPTCLRRRGDRGRRRVRRRRRFAVGRGLVGIRSWRKPGNLEQLHLPIVVLLARHENDCGLRVGCGGLVLPGRANGRCGAEGEDGKTHRPW